jgi:hypothetical protein
MSKDISIAFGLSLLGSQLAIAFDRTKHLRRHNKPPATEAF